MKVEIERYEAMSLYGFTFLIIVMLESTVYAIGGSAVRFKRMRVLLKAIKVALGALQ